MANASLKIDVSVANLAALESLIQSLESLAAIAKQGFSFDPSFGRDLQNAADQAQEAADTAEAAARQTQSAGDEISKTFGKKALDGIVSLSFGFNQVMQSAQMLGAQLTGIFEQTIGANERLNQQLLESASTITATSRILQGGIEVEDPTESIKLLQGPLKEAIKDVEVSTQSLVGVTSSDVSTVFNTILQNVSQLNGQLKQSGEPLKDLKGNAIAFRDPIEAAAKLAPGLVATLGTLGLPMQQAADEINNLLKGQIDSTAQVAKSLGISKQQIDGWKQQGILVQELYKSFEPFLAANQLAAKSISGITSNFQDLIEVTARSAGEPLLMPLVDSLQAVYDIFNDPARKDGIIGFFQGISTIVLDAATRIGDAFRPAIAALFGAVESSGPAATAAISAFADQVVLVAQVVGAAATPVAELLRLFTQLASTELGQIAVQAAVVGLAIAQLQGPATALLTTIQGLGQVTQIASLAAQFPIVGTAVEGLTKSLGGVDDAFKLAKGGGAGLATTVSDALKVASEQSLLFGDALGKGVAKAPEKFASLKTAIIATLKDLPKNAASIGVQVGEAIASNAKTGVSASKAIGAALAENIRNLPALAKGVGDAVSAMGAKSIVAIQAMQASMAAFAATVKAGGVAGLFSSMGAAISSAGASISAALASASAGVTSLGAAAGAATAPVVGLMAALGPLIALGGAIALTVLVKKTGDLKAAQEELDAYGRGLEANGNLTLKLAKNLTELNEKQKAGTISESETSRLNQLKAIARQQAEVYQQEIAALKQLKVENEAQRNNRDIQIKDREAQIKLIQKTALNLDIQGRSLQDLGSTAEQVAQKLKGTQDVIAQQGSGDRGAFDAAIKERLELLQQGSELGLVAEANAKKELEAIIKNADVSFETKQKAVDQLNKLDEIRLKALESNNKAEIALIELRSQGSEEAEREGIERAAALQADALKQRLTSVQEAIARERELLESGEGSQSRLNELIAQEKNLTAETLKQGQERSNKLAALAKEDVDRTKSLNDAQIEIIRAGSDTSFQAQADGLTKIQQLQEETLNARVEANEAAIAREQELLEKGVGDATKLASLLAEQKQLGSERVKIAEDTARQITEVEQQASEARKAILEADIKEIELQVERGKMSRLEAAEETASIQQRISDQQVAATTAAIKREQDLIAQGQGSAINLEKLKTQLRQQQQERENVIIQGEKKIAQEQLKILEDRQREAASIEAKAEVDRKIEIERRRQALKAQGASESSIQRQVAQEDIEATRKALQTKLKANEKYVADLEALPTPDSEEDVRAREEKIRSAKTETANLTLQLLQNQRAAQEQLTQTAIAGIDRQAKATQTTFDRIISGLRNQQELLSAQGELQGAVDQLEQGRLNRRIALAKEGSAVDDLRIKAALLAEDSLARQLVVEKQQLDIKFRMLSLENELAQIEAERELTKARLNGASKEELDSLQRVIDKQKEAAGLIQQQQALSTEAFRATATNRLEEAAANTATIARDSKVNQGIFADARTRALDSSARADQILGATPPPIKVDLPTAEQTKPVGEAIAASFAATGEQPVTAKPVGEAIATEFAGEAATKAESATQAQEPPVESVSEGVTPRALTEKQKQQIEQAIQEAQSANASSPREEAERKAAELSDKSVKALQDTFKDALAGRGGLDESKVRALGQSRVAQEAAKATAEGRSLTPSDAAAIEEQSRKTAERLAQVLKENQGKDDAGRQLALLREATTQLINNNPNATAFLDQLKALGFEELATAASALAESSSSLFDASAKLSKAEDGGKQGLAALLSSLNSVKSFKMGGDAAPGIVMAAEAGPELVSFADGSNAIASTPGLYNLPQSAHIYTAEQTAAMAKRLGRSMLLGSEQTAAIAAPLGGLFSPSGIAGGQGLVMPSIPGQEMLNELQLMRSQLRQISKNSAKPITAPPAQVAVHVDGPDYNISWERSRGAAAARRGGLS